MCIMSRLIHFGPLAIILGFSANADVMYDFKYTATSGPIASFNFSITQPALISGGSPSFTPFTITDGNNSWTMAADAASQNCIAFSTVAGGPPVAFPGGCGFNTNSFGEGGFYFALNTLSSLGTFLSPSSFGQFYTASDAIEYFSTFDFPGVTKTTGQFRVDVTSVPEPSSGILLLSCLLTSGWTVKRQLCRNRNRRRPRSDPRE